MIKVFLQSVAAWVLLIGGIAIVAAAVLCPLDREVSYMQRQLALMRDQAGELAKQEVGYKRFHMALATDDPVVLERVAYYQLRLKPAGTQAIRLRPGTSPFDVMSMPDDTGLAHQTRDALPTVEALLHRPLPSAREYLGINAGPRSRLDRLTTGWKRLLLLGAGVLCLCASMISVGSHEQREKRMRDVPVKVRRK